MVSDKRPARLVHIFAMVEWVCVCLCSAPIYTLFTSICYFFFLSSSLVHFRVDNSQDVQCTSMSMSSALLSSSFSSTLLSLSLFHSLFSSLLRLLSFHFDWWYIPSDFFACFYVFFFCCRSLLSLAVLYLLRIFFPPSFRRCEMRITNCFRFFLSISFGIYFISANIGHTSAPCLVREKQRLTSRKSVPNRICIWTARTPSSWS